MMDFAQYEGLVFERRDHGVLLITINRRYKIAGAGIRITGPK